MKAIVLLCALIPLAYAANWAVLIAGSNGFGNYRHQADVCHSYQILHKNGIPDEHIITFMYDDIANSGQNPFKGQIFNKPTAAGVAGADVYHGVPHDYTGADTTAKNLLAVLQGQKDQVPAGKKVLESTSEDNVFIYFSDHGGVGLIAMPVGGYLYSTDLIAALKNMFAKKMYAKLVFYLEACESGSMFDKILPTDINIFATTAANPSESSWGWYCSPEDMVNGKHVGSCLGDEYSVRWLEDSDLSKSTETLQDQFLTVQKATTKSHVMQYGTMSFNAEPIWNFQGHNATVAKTVGAAAPQNKGAYGVDSRDVQLHYLYHQYLRNPTQVNAEALRAEIESRTKADAFFANFARTVYGNDHKSVLTMAPKTVCDQKCCQPVVNYMQASCGGFTDYSMKYIKSIVNMCEQGSDAEYMLQAAKDLCL